MKTVQLLNYARDSWIPGEGILAELPSEVEVRFAGPGRDMLDLALRRLDKEVYFFNYNNERHGLRRRANQRDFTKRMHQFFDHFLKGAPAPDWMAHGIPYLERAEEKLRFQDAP